MLFSSVTFLYYFLPITLLLYYLVPKACKNVVLLLSSLIFYGWGEPRYLFVMLFSVLSGYVLGLLIEKYREGKLGKVFLVLSLCSSVGTLGYYKYVDFFIENFAKVTGMPLTTLRIALPMGISFYTFQIMSYTVDVYRGEVKAQSNLVTLATYITMFPQLIAGPIVRYQDLESALSNRSILPDEVWQGGKRFLIGLGKKVLLANTFGEFVAQFQNAREQSVLFYWLYALAYTLQIYYDFSGYSDMAIGLGKMLGFTFPENFQYPYISTSITEFWRRWHMTLGGWFRDYVYIPLGGNRVPKWKWIRNIFIVWFLTGFWHGAAWNFILWGLFYGVLLLVEKLWLGKYLHKNLLSHLYVMLCVMVGFVIFGAENIGEAKTVLAGMIGFSASSAKTLGSGLPFASQESIYYGKSFFLLFFFGILGAFGWPANFGQRMKLLFEGEKSVLFQSLEGMWFVGILLLATAYLVDGSFNPFLYFRF